MGPTQEEDETPRERTWHQDLMSQVEEELTLEV